MIKTRGASTVAKSILHTIESGMSGFSKGQKRIAGYILENYDKAAFMTASKLGKLVGVSESTVVRFASELGYDGYPSMQRALQEMIRSRLTSTQRIQAAGDLFDHQDLLGAVLQSDIDKLREIVGEADRTAFNNVVERIMHARHIYILGVRSSSFVAGYLNFYMHLLCENVTLVQSNAAGEIFEQLFRIGPDRHQLPPVLQGDDEYGEIRPGPGSQHHCHYRQRAFSGLPDVRRGAAGTL